MHKNASSLANLLQICINNKLLKAGKLIQAHIHRTSQLSNTFLVNRLIHLYFKCGFSVGAHYLFDQMPTKNIFSYHAVLDSCSKSNDVAGAYKIFEQMPERNEVSWNLLIGMFSKSGFKDKALESYYSMRLDGFIPTHFTLASVLSVCGSMGDFDCGRECHGVATKLGLDENLYVGNAVMGLYTKCGYIEDAFAIHERLPEHNQISFTALMEGLFEAGRVDEALDMFRLIHKAGSVDRVSLLSVLDVCSFLVNSGTEESCRMQGKQIHCIVVKLGFQRDVQVNNSLLDMYAKQGDMNSAEKLFLSSPGVTVVSWNIMISGYGNVYQKDKAVECLKKMQSSGFEPDEVTHVNMLSAYLKNGDIEGGLQVFYCMSSPSLASWNAVLSGCLQHNRETEAVTLFKEMMLRNITPDRTTFASVISAYSSLGLLQGGKQIHACLLKTDFCTDLYISSGLISVYSKCAEIELAKRVFNMVAPNLDVVCWNSMLAGLSMNSMEMEAFLLFQRMLREGLKPTEFSCATLLNCGSSLTSLPLGKQIHGLMVKNGHADDVYVGTALIHMYCKCSDVEKARWFFDIMPVKSVVTWNVMIHGYAQNGQGEDAVNLFKEMTYSGHKPDTITFVAVLTACSHSGLIDAGLEIFNSMKEEHGVEPLTDHYTCIIDSLCRSGLFTEVEHMIDKMLCKDDRIIWEALLSSCRVHGNVKLARRAANELILLNHKDPAPYSLLANMYSSLDRWEDVKEVRSTMNEYKISKEPGYSWI